jgi:transcriptional regulator with XRE-family HTH domain
MSSSATIASSDATGRGPTAADLVVGRRLRSLRRSRNRSLQELATATGLSIGLISQIERGLSSPSVKSLVALGEALGVGIAWFFDDTAPLDAEETDLVVRSDRRRALSMGEGEVAKQLLSPDPRRGLQLYLIIVEPGGSTGPGLYAHSGESGGLVLSGQLLLWIEDRHFLLKEGDSFSVPANAPRRFANPDPQQRTKLLWSVARPLNLDANDL